MGRSIALTLPSGRTVFAEVDEADRAGWQDLAGGDATKSAPGKVAEAFETLRELLEVAAERVQAIGPRPPDVVTLEMSVELATGGVVKLLGGSATGGLKVSLTWNADGRGG